jgi:hypothetical protein
MLDFHAIKRDWYPTHAKRNAQINRPLFDGRGRWETEMSEEQKTLFKKSKANALLLEFGYVDTLDW